ncbi:MAG: GNAT family N-acetyltransferase [Leeuwenhoekiella sp.]
MTNGNIIIEQPSAEFLELHGNFLFHSQEWLDVLKGCYDFDFYVVRQKVSNQYLIFALIKNSFEQKLVSLPFSDYAGETNLKSSVVFDLLAALRAQFPKIPIIFKSRMTTIDDCKLPLENIKQGFYHRINLKAKGITKPENIQSSSFKRAVKKATKAGVQVEKGHSEKVLKEFHRLYYELRLAKFHIIPQPYSFFRKIFEIFIKNEKGFILKATHQGQTIAAVIILIFKNVWYYKFGASGEDNLGLRPNNLIFDELTRMAILSDVEAIDLGFSGSGDSYAGLRRFKEQMGGEAEDINVYKYSGSPEFEGDKSLLSQLTKSIVEENLSQETVDKFSEILYPYFA